MNLESLGNQLVKSANILTSWSVLFLWLLRYSVHIIESFYGTEFYFNWIKAFLYDSRNRETICMVRKSAKNFHPEEIKIFLMIRKTDGTDWHLDVTTEPLLAPQSFLNIPLCNLCQNKWLPFLGLLLSSHAVLQIFVLYGYSIRDKDWGKILYILGFNCGELQTQLSELEETFSEEVETKKEKVTCRTRAKI